MLVDFCGLYNACFQQRIEACRRQRRTLRYADQAAELRAVWAEVPAVARWSFTALQQVLRRVETTYGACFGRGRGFPRFRAASRYHAATFDASDGPKCRGADDASASSACQVRSKRCGIGRFSPVPSSAQLYPAAGADGAFIG